MRLDDFDGLGDDSGRHELCNLLGDQERRWNGGDELWGLNDCCDDWSLSNCDNHWCLSLSDQKRSNEYTLDDWSWSFSNQDGLDNWLLVLGGEQWGLGNCLDDRCNDLGADDRSDLVCLD